MGFFMKAIFLPAFSKGTGSVNVSIVYKTVKYAYSH